MRKLIICALVLACSIFAGCQETIVEVPELLEPVGVKSDMVTIEKGDIQKVAIYNGEIVPYVEEVQFTVDGVFEAFHVRLGDKVTKGQLLAQLNSESVQESIEVMEEPIADIKNAGAYEDRQIKADITIAKTWLAMLEESDASAEECEIQKREIVILEEALEQQQQLRNLDLQQKYNQLARLQEEAAQLEVVAPIDGTVVYVKTALDPLDWVSGYTTVICIADESKFWISAETISSYELKQAVDVSAIVLEKEYDITEYPYETGEYLSMVTAKVTVDTRFTFDKPSEELKCGQYAQIKVVKELKEDVLTIPKNALHEDDTGIYVYKYEDEQRVRCDVEIGMISDVEIEILSGLQEGDTVYVKE